jgi:hypothetical protein
MSAYVLLEPLMKKLYSGELSLDSIKTKDWINVLDACAAPGNKTF